MGERREADFRALKLRHFLNIFLSSLPEVKETLSRVNSIFFMSCGRGEIKFGTQTFIKQKQATFRQTILSYLGRPLFLYASNVYQINSSNWCACTFGSDVLKRFFVIYSKSSLKQFAIIFCCSWFPPHFNMYTCQKVRFNNHYL